MKQLFRLLLLLSFIQLNESTLYAASYKTDSHLHTGYHGGSMSVFQDGYYFTTRPAAKSGSRKCRIAVKEEDDDDSNTLRLKKEKSRSAASHVSYIDTCHYYGLLCSGYTHLLKHRFFLKRRYLPYASYRTHVMLEVFRI